jgi:lipopolysaccharide transport system ATP-binding protein
MPEPVIRVRDLEKRYRVWAHTRPTNLKERLRIVGATARARAGVGDSVAVRRDVWALRGVSFDVPRGEVLGVIGRNGAGKSTLLSILARITEPTGGYAELNGRTSSLLEVGTGFHPELTGRDNVFLNGAILGMTRAETARKYDEIVAFAGVQDFMEIPVKRYSSGMQVRLAFAVAAHLDPEILLLDEVLAVGDQEFQARCLARVQSMISSGRTVLFVSHNLDAVSRLCRRAIYIDAGRISFDGTADQAIERYLLAHRAQGGPEHPGLGPVRIRRVAVQTAGVGTGLRSGDGVRLEIDVDCDSHGTGEFSLEVAIRTPAGEDVVTATTPFATVRGSLRLVCDLPELPLRPATYLVSSVVTHDGADVDRWDDATELTLHARDGASDSGARAGGGLVVLRHSWTVTESPASVSPDPVRTPTPTA